MTGVLRVALAIAQGAPLEEIFAAVAEAAARRVGAEAGAVLRYMGDERAVVEGTWREGGSRGFPVNAELDFDRRNSATGRVRATGQPARADSYDGVRGELPTVMRAVELRSSVVAPVRVDGEVWGALVASSVRAEPLAAGAEHELAELAELAGHVVARAAGERALRASRRRLVAAGDAARRGLERDLHDGLQQHLLALVATLRAARSRAAAGGDAGALLEDAMEAAVALNDELREFGRDLYPNVLAERGLAAAVQALAARAGVPVHLRALPRRRFAETAEATAYFVVAEALAGAAEAEVAVAEEAGRLVVEVRRAGAEPADVNVLAERVAAVGGRWLHDGASLRAELPL